MYDHIDGIPTSARAVRRLTIATLLAIASGAIGLAIVACSAAPDRGAATAQAIRYAPVACAAYEVDPSIPREAVLDAICAAVLKRDDLPAPDAGAVSARDSGDPAPALSVTPGNGVRAVDGGG